MSKIKYFKIIPGVLISGIMIYVLLNGLLSDNKCNRKLNNSETNIKLMKVSTSEKKLLGKSIDVLTTYKDENLYFRTRGFKEVLPKGLPIYIEYSIESPKCYRFLWDSIVNTEDYQVKYYYIENEGYSYKIIRK